MFKASPANARSVTQADLSDDPLIAFLKSIQNQHVHIFPKSGNAGDGFITYATFTLLKRYGISFTTHHQHETIEGQTVLIGGGGNLVEGRYDDVAELIRRHADKNRVVLLPHTIVGFADILAHTHRNLTVFCREPVSYQLALLNGADEAATHLSHDMVFFLESDHFSEFIREGVGTLTALRQDGESSGGMPISGDNVDLSSCWNGDIWTSPDFCKHVTRSLAAFITPHASVYTDRLHVSILSAFLQKNVYMMPNAYFKNRAVFEHSIKPRFPHVTFVNVLRELEDMSAIPAKLAEKVSPPQTPDNDMQAKYLCEIGVHEKRIADLEVRLAQANETAEREMIAREKSERSHQILQQSWQQHNHDLVQKHELERHDLADEVHALQSGVERLREQVAHSKEVQRNLDAVLSSTFWRLSKPIRTGLIKLRALRRAA
ncbi:polysaccharide pyruvyl transferase family protein [Caballeronia sp. BR00000012568055]|uniref:polysaccharide pyruvyl transferase family protein n=1 Tax=Caballeronia sp. BR00000012568055 TaxID=2918761 RepID=UPI0023F8DB07|nr:polysaccharide pyruvyl transferase family protein [Caballeronia sp. BR00000012568055]